MFIKSTENHISCPRSLCKMFATSNPTLGTIFFHDRAPNGWVRLTDHKSVSVGSNPAPVLRHQAAQAQSWLISMVGHQDPSLLIPAAGRHAPAEITSLLGLHDLLRFVAWAGHYAPQQFVLYSGHHDSVRIASLLSLQAQQVSSDTPCLEHGELVSQTRLGVARLGEERCIFVASRGSIPFSGTSTQLVKGQRITQQQARTLACEKLGKGIQNGQSLGLPRHTGVAQRLIERLSNMQEVAKIRLQSNVPGARSFGSNPAPRTKQVYESTTFDFRGDS